ncbi:MAG TPA: flagellar motor stator protein MotA [Bryobacteraceae bacterium]|nr:flagellar motor stator protein MotA [Bryobacteraceae bacterium]
MFPIIGIAVVIGCIVGGYLIEKGNLLVLMQPAELLIILGSAVGTVLIGNPPYLLKGIIGGILGVVKGSRYSSGIYLDTLRFLNDFFGTCRKNGLTALEKDLDEPDKSALFKRHPNFAGNKEAMNFFCDTMRTLLAGGVEVHDLDHVMETDLEVLHRQSRLPAGALSTMADSLPGLGIVAAVLGVVITMGALGGPPEEIGHKVAAALVGTFLGVLLCYGLVGPLAANMKKQTDAESEYFLALRMGMLAYMKGVSPLLALEAARRAIPHHVRPTFQEMDKACRKAPAAASEAAA